MDETMRACPWCSARIAADAKACPECGAALEQGAAPEPDIPGLTSVDPRASLDRPLGALPDPLGWRRAGDQPVPGGDEAFQPPSEAVRLEMRRLELEAEKTRLENT
jgi:hypothetical protein